VITRYDPEIKVTGASGYSGLVAHTSDVSLEYWPIPKMFWAYTLNLYVRPLVNPETVTDVPTMLLRITE